MNVSMMISSVLRIGWTCGGSTVAFTSAIAKVALVLAEAA